MRTYYEYPLGTTFYALTDEAMAARCFGGKPDDYICTRHDAYCGGRYVEVVTYPGLEYVADVPILTNDGL